MSTSGNPSMYSANQHLSSPEAPKSGSAGNSMIYGDSTGSKVGSKTFSTFFNKEVLLGATLFGALSPGLLLTIPPESRGVLMSGQTSPRAIAVHTGVFVLAYGLGRKFFGTD
eukprot:TRINITY_DN10535_c0_g1_i2.p2 TRINITY_DN10535_c0_g1~~TRINITY_DN10535_c0_g1_i2.p2  ORF type:complete len:121 (+),score=12.48 TRINITY_DN10535_c0_g1_i2:29-364(+)